MHRKLLSMVLSVALLGGLMVVGAAAPALAAPPTNTQNFYPDDTAAFGTDATRLSDRFDGVDQTVHLTNVSTTDTTRVQWRLCPSTTVTVANQSSLTQAQFNSCTIIIGEDSTPTTPVGNGVSTVDEAYEFNWDIPGTEDGQTRDLVAAACIGAGEDVETTGQNCALDIENNVRLDDAATATPQTSSGEMYAVCTSDADGPGVGTNPCNDPTPGDGVIDPAAAALYQPFVHGASLPNTGFVIRARTSDDLTATNVATGAGDAVTDPRESFSSSVGCTVIFTGTNFKEWECSFSAAGTPDNSELYLDFWEFGGQGLCAGDPPFCTFDNHYVVTAARAAQSVVATFRDKDTTTTDRVDCQTPDDAETNNLGDTTEVVLFCVTDQFGLPFDAPVTFESTGPSSAGFDSLGCTEQNHDNDAAGVDEHCDGSTGADGVVEAIAVNPDNWVSPEPALRGVQTITACVEGEPFTALPVPAGHGCADEPATLKDTVAKTWESDATEVRLVFGDKTANCLTGPTFKENLVGDTDNLLACTFDGFGNVTPTTGTNDGFLEWSIGTGNDDDVDTQYAGPPPSETDADAEAVAVIEAIDPGNDRPAVCLRSDTTGDNLWCDSVQKNVRAVPGPATSAISIRHKRHRFKGSVTSSDTSCVSGRNVVLKRVKPGPDRTIGTDVTDAAGKYSIRHRKTRVAKRYYTRVRGTSTCGGARSRTLRRR